MTRPLALLAALVLAGCPAPRQPLDAPPDVRYAVDPCDRCQMIVSEERFASAYVTPAGEVRRFDDLGCLTAFLRERPEQVGEVWVHDHEGKGWLRGREATFVRAPGVKTPMGTGLVAAAEAARAAALAGRTNGETLGWDAFVALGPGAFPEGGR